MDGEVEKGGWSEGRAEQGERRDGGARDGVLESQAPDGDAAWQRDRTAVTNGLLSAETGVGMDSELIAKTGRERLRRDGIE